MFNDLLNGDLQQAFLLGAFNAISRFRSEDDGRGKNDFAGFCAWTGMNAVLDRIRQAAREVKRKSGEIAVGDFTESRSSPGEYMSFASDSRMQSAIAIDDPTRDLVSTTMIAEFMEKLTPKDRIVAGLLNSGYGPAQRNNDPHEQNRGRRQNYLRELELATGYSEQKLMASLRRLRKAAAEHWGVDYDA